MSVRDYLKAMDDIMRQSALTERHQTLYGYYLEHGHQMESRSFTPTEKRAVWKDVSRIGPKVKQCFYNAQKLMLFNVDKYVYVEGFVTSPRVPIAIHHGWAVLKETLQLVDPTLKLDHDKRYSSGNIVMGRLPDGWDYFGVPFKPEQVRSMWFETENAGPVAEHILYNEYRKEQSA